MLQPSFSQKYQKLKVLSHHAVQLRIILKKRRRNVDLKTKEPQTGCNSGVPMNLTEHISSWAG